MLVISCIKQVPDTTQVKIDPVTNTLIRDGIPFIINPYDSHALEESLRLKDRYSLRTVALSMGPPNTVATLRKACALGVDEAILLSDRCFGAANPRRSPCSSASNRDDRRQKVGKAAVFLDWPAI